jgi:hypothetical protein
VVLVRGPAQLLSTPNADAEAVWMAPDGQRMRVLGVTKGLFNVEVMEAVDGSSGHTSMILQAWARARDLQPICQVCCQPRCLAGVDCPKVDFAVRLPKDRKGRPLIAIEGSGSTKVIRAFGHTVEVAALEEPNHFLFATGDSAYPWGYYVEPTSSVDGVLLAVGPKGFVAYQRIGPKEASGTNLRLVRVEPSGSLVVRQGFGRLELLLTLAVRGGVFTITGSQVPPSQRDWKVEPPYVDPDEPNLGCLMVSKKTGKSLLLPSGDPIEILGLCADPDRILVKRKKDGATGCLNSDTLQQCLVP